MKRSKSQSEYSQSDSEPETETESDSESESSSEKVVYSDTEIDYTADIVVIFPGSSHNPKVAPKPKTKHKRTKIEITREKTLKKIKSLENNSEETLLNQILDSKLTLQCKSKLVSDLENLTDKDKIKSYVKRILKIPTEEVDISSGDENIIYNLRKNLDDVVYGHSQTKEEIIDFVTGKLSNPDNYKSQILALNGPPGIGKCHAKDTRILMFNGDYKLVQNIVIGDKIMGDDSTVRNVTNLGSGTDLIYEISHKASGKTYKVNSEHILCLMSTQDKSILEIPVKEYIKLPASIKYKYRGYSTSVEFPHKELCLDIEQTCKFTEEPSRLPAYFKINSMKIRIEVLHHICKNIGFYEGDTASIIVHGVSLFEDIMWLIDSLGFLCTSKLINGVYYIKIHRDAYYIKNYNEYKHTICKEEISIEPIGSSQYWGFTLDGNCRYVIGDFIVTHNTRFIRALGEALKLPFNQISFGGLSDAAVLTGHDYTYIGSKPGKIYEAVAKSKYKNSIIYLDEIDKIASPDSEKFIAINGVLTHMLDPEQNSEFHDNYLGDISLDLSKVFFIVSFNNKQNIDPVVLNRLKVIEIKESSLLEKIEIVKRFSIPDICKNIGVKLDSFTIEDSCIKYIISVKTIQDKGMRSINKNIFTLFSKINTLLCIENSPQEIRSRIVSGLSYEKVTISNYRVDGKLNINKELIDFILKPIEQPLYHMMYI
jgi:SpoVK/Ycf46/Vps4 family AAA+-type ATPase